MMHRLYLPTLLLMTAACGCVDGPNAGEDPQADTQPAEASRSEATQATSTAATSTQSPSETDQVTAQVMSWDEAQQQVSDLKGQIVVVDVWSTDCLPCIREFPHLVALQKEHPDELACVSINIDFLGIDDQPSEQLRDKVLAFLKKHDAVTTNVICSDPADDIYGKVDFVAIPAVYVYRRDGELAKLFKNDQGEYGSDGFTYEEHIVPFVEELLAE